MRVIDNEPIAYDDHGSIPFDVPFSDIQPKDISLYLQLDTRVGKETCQQTCAHCFYINQPAAANRSIDLQEGRFISDCLKARGYKIFPMIADSFARDGEFLTIFGNSHNRDLCQEIDSKPTKTMYRGDLWTSGAPLLKEGWHDLLCRTIENGFGSVTITFHGTLNSELQLHPHVTYPIQGVFAGHSCETVIERIHTFNRDLMSKRIRQLEHLDPVLRLPLAINIGLTLGKHNHTFEHILNYVKYFQGKNIDVLRFNAFHDHSGRHPELVLTEKDTIQCYRDIKWIHENIQLNFQLGIDEDFGTSGIEVMGFPSHTGWCRAGRQLFAIVPTQATLLEIESDLMREEVGIIAACVDAFKPIVGRLVRVTSSKDNSVDYDLVFDHSVIEELHRKRTVGIYQNGCFAAEMLLEEHAVLSH